MPNPMVYHFGAGRTDGGARDKALLGGKGANLAEMATLGVPVPPGFTITTDVCNEVLRTRTWPEGLEEQVRDAVRRLEEATGRQFGGDRSPLLVSVRSGAAVSMPGMMETILNLGLNRKTVEALAGESENRRFAFDSYRRFIQMYGAVVLGIEARVFEHELEERKAERRVEMDTDLGAEDLEHLVARFEDLVRASTGEPFPEDPWDQLHGAIDAVFESWLCENAVNYRRVNHIPDDLGTAVNVCTMVFGNMGDDSGTGVAFTRNPSTGERRFFGEFLLNAQGEDVVAGIRDPISIDAMKELLPAPYEELLEVQAKLERHYRDMQDLEFTVERGKLYLLQTRTGKRTGAAAVRIAVEMVDEGLITEAEALSRVDPAQLDQLLHPRVDPKANATILARGLPASPGAASGRLVFDPDEAAARAEKGEDVILVRNETSPDDFHGMVAARAIVTARGGMTSHAAVVARGMGKCCVVGARGLHIDEKAECVRAGGHTLTKDEWVTVDGTHGRMLIGKVATVEGQLSAEYDRLMGWADRARTLKVRTNADTPHDARTAREFGAEGIGLCRTEHMFFQEGRIFVVREMILARDEAGRRAALDKLLPMQRSDFEGIFRAMEGVPVTIRTLDPPLHEFLPRTADEVRATARALGVGEDEVTRQVEKHRESNPMLGLRGVRLGLCYPEITEMQARAIFEAAAAVAQDGVVVRPEVMIPLVGTVKELEQQAKLVRRVADEVLQESGVSLPYLVGTMIELPRAALTAGEIAKVAEFFSFGTNDLTQTTFGISRDDAGSFLPFYLEKGILPVDPFQVLDRDGVGRLVEIAVRDGRAARPDIKLGICGEHGGEPRSVEFFHEAGLEYVSCSPYRVPVARLAAARAAVAGGGTLRPEKGTPPGRLDGRSRREATVMADG